jgi:hypothetical protein
MSRINQGSLLSSWNEMKLAVAGFQVAHRIGTLPEYCWLYDWIWLNIKQKIAGWDNLILEFFFLPKDHGCLSCIVNFYWMVIDGRFKPRGNTECSFFM